MSVEVQKLNPYLLGLANGIDKIRSQVETLTAGLSDKQLRWSPDRKTWSIGQVLDHLNKVAEPLIPTLAHSIETCRNEGKLGSPPFKYSLMERVFIRIVSPNPPFKVPVPPMFVPALPQELSGVVARFLEFQNALKAAIVNTDGLDLKSVRFPSPANDKMKFCLGAWLESTVAHEQYHLLQAQAVRNDPSFPTV